MGVGAVGGGAVGVGTMGVGAVGVGAVGVGAEVWTLWVWAPWVWAPRCGRCGENTGIFWMRTYQCILQTFYSKGCLGLCQSIWICL